ncbi:basic leucine zipper transcriptional factor ATF-like 3 [Hemiscyllium ocellatum]|uniref:basic leucine zipper transcriptional factor ATF-like 3 n=1 Tax=Hemiscyllium ocellatum TaxID=170820 RepID=UPI00296699CF|nr:basic leucine zipper transcriptional factor ATF-like 3 [Hemiscyllium ocellatum]
MSEVNSPRLIVHSPANDSSTDRESQDFGSDNKRLRRREKNRIAAQRSRKKQTQKADKLHEEYERLEQENTALKREIRKLSEEVKHLSEVLKDHERICPLIQCTMNFVTMPRPHSDGLASCLPRRGQSEVS